jgi:hypothetical protein
MYFSDGVEGLVAGLAHDGELGDAVEVSLAAEAGAEGVTGVGSGIEAGFRHTDGRECIPQPYIQWPRSVKKLPDSDADSSPCQVSARVVALSVCHAEVMQQWEYRIFASHLDPADLVVIMNESGKDGWELVTVVAVTDYQPLDLIEPAADPEKTDEVVQLEAFRYVFKRPVS